MPESQVKRIDIADKTTLDIVARKASNLSSATSTQSTTIDTIKQNLKTSDTSVYESISDTNDNLDYIAGKIQYVITVITQPNISVSATKNGSTISGTTDANGKCKLILPEVGTWVVSATNGTLTTQSTVILTNSQWSRSVYLELFSATLTVYVDAGSTVTITHNGESSTRTANSNGRANFAIRKSGDYIVSAMKENAPSNVISINISSNGKTYTTSLSFRKINITVESGASVTVVNGSTTISFLSYGSKKTVYIPNDGTWQITGTSGSKSLSETITVDSFTTYTVEFEFVHIYGVEWDGSSNPQCTRTDESALFEDPEPYVADGNHPGSSPFDNCMPWSGMEVEFIDGAGGMVRIPKFWFKVTTEGTKRKIQIADKAVAGFSVSPAHQDRGDGKGERDYVFVSKFHVDRNYTTYNFAEPLTNITRSEARAGCASIGPGFCQFDIMTLITIWYLYLVEFAHWDSQEKIGYGCGDGVAPDIVGASINMPYHTGTMQSSRTTYGVGTQYRWIEDLWGNVMDWVDGIYFSDANIYAIKNPANFSDTSGGTKVGTRPTDSNEIKAWKDSTVSGYKWFVYPSDVYNDSNYATYCCDHLGYYGSGVVLCFGGCCDQHPYCGLFYLGGDGSASYSSADVGARLLYLP